MSAITREAKRRDVHQAFDEACDLVRAGDADKALLILTRAMPATQARQAHENIVAVFGAKAKS